MVVDMIENPEPFSDLDPLQLPWEQTQRKANGYLFVVSLSNPETFEITKAFIEKI